MVAPTQMEQALVNMYVPGAGIGWHRDAPPFGPTVVGISLASEEVMRFRRQVGNHFEMYKQPLERRSLMFSVDRRARTGNTVCRRQNSCLTPSHSAR